MIYFSSAKDGTVQEKGWPEYSYGVTKIGVTLMTYVHQKELNKDQSRPDIVVNAVSYVALSSKGSMEICKKDHILDPGSLGLSFVTGQVYCVINRAR